jgi:excisionase family DNA binding protein
MKRLEKGSADPKNGFAIASARGIVRPVSAIGVAPVGATQPLFDKLLTADDVASILAISVKSVYRLAKTRRIPAINIGRVVRFKPEDIAEIRHGLRTIT